MAHTLVSLTTQAHEAAPLAEAMTAALMPAFTEFQAASKSVTAAKAAEVDFWETSPLWQTLSSWVIENYTPTGTHSSVVTNMIEVTAVSFAEISSQFRGRSPYFKRFGGFRFDHGPYAGYLPSDPLPMLREDTGHYLELLGRLTAAAGGKESIEALLDQWQSLRDSYHQAIEYDTQLNITGCLPKSELDDLDKILTSRYAQIMSACEFANAVWYVVDRALDPEDNKIQAMRWEAGCSALPPATLEQASVLARRVQAALTKEPDEIDLSRLGSGTSSYISPDWRSILETNPLVIIFARYTFMVNSVPGGLDLTANLLKL